MRIENAMSLIDAKVEFVTTPDIPSRLWGEFGKVIDENIVIKNQRYCKIELDNPQSGFGSTFVCLVGNFRFR
jgi:hypothetical protein